MLNKPNQFIRLRKEKLEKIKALGINPYPVKSSRTHYISALLQDREEWIQKAEEVSITGRLTAMRRQGKIGFGDLEDISGKDSALCSSKFNRRGKLRTVQTCDPGDFIQATEGIFTPNW